MHNEPGGGSLRRLRATGLTAVAGGAVGSLALMFHASQRTPRLLVVIFFFWVLSPFGLLALAERVSARWSAATRAALYVVMLVIALGSLAIYADDARGHRRPQAAFVYVAVPPASWLLLGVVVPIAAVMARRRTRRE